MPVYLEVSMFNGAYSQVNMHRFVGLVLLLNNCSFSSTTDTITIYSGVAILLVFIWKYVPLESMGCTAKISILGKGYYSKRHGAKHC